MTGAMILAVLLSGAASTTPEGPLVAVDIRGLEDIAWGRDAGRRSPDVEFTGLSSSERRALRVQLHATVEASLRSAGLRVVEGDKACGLPTFAIVVSTSQARRHDEILVEVDAQLIEPATLARHPEQSASAIVWSGTRHAVVHRPDVTSEITFHAKHWADYFGDAERSRLN